MLIPIPLRRIVTDDAGFILIGVVMIVLALTILALSLFSLSSFEAQFFERSARETRAYYAASGGLEWAKLVLARDTTMAALRAAAQDPLQRPEGVIYARARRVGSADTIGNVDFTGTVPLEVRVLADDGAGGRRMVEAVYYPSKVDHSLYRNLMDSATTFEIPLEDSEHPGVNRRDQLFLYGQIRLNDDTWPDPPEWNQAPWYLTNYTRAGGVVPDPQVVAFMADHPSGSPVPFDSGQNEYTLWNDGAGPKFFRTDHDPEFSLNDHNQFPSPEIRVRGDCIWMFPRGVRFRYRCRVRDAGYGDGRLVIVAGEGAEHGVTAGIWFTRELDSPTVPVILVSDSKVYLEAYDTITQNSVVNNIAVFAKSIELIGPTAPYTASYRRDAAMDAFVDDIAHKLPNYYSGTSATFDLAAGSWREVAESSPIP